MWNITLKKEEKDKMVHPELHSQFIEFLGGCIHDGIWVGKDSKIPNYDGIRKDTADALKEIAPPVIRWPGGCYADMYHWRDGIGSHRPVTWNENFGTEAPEDNGFGTDEFMRLCEMVGAKPWLNINMLRGTTQEAVEWAEYCNRAEGTSLADERAANGHPQPYHVSYWGIGNEAWAGGGTYTAEGYANEYRRYASAMPQFDGGMAVDPAMKLIAVGPDGNKKRERVEWTRDLFEALSAYRFPKLWAMDLHFYNWNLTPEETSESDFDENGWNRVVQGCLEIEDVIREQYELIQEGVKKAGPVNSGIPGAKASCRLVIGEWGNWHGCAFKSRPALYQQCTMRDAVTTALTLDIFHRNCDKVDMACAAQTVNVLNSLILTEGEDTILTPNYHVFRMYMPHRGAKVLDFSEESDDGSSEDKPYVFASKKDHAVTVNLVNASMTKKETVRIRKADGLSYVHGTVLASDDPHRCNTRQVPDAITPAKAEEPVQEEDGSFVFALPAASVTVLEFQT